MFLTSKYVILVTVILALSYSALAQSNSRSLYFWKLHSITGEARIDAHYRAQEQYGANMNENLESSYLSGGALLKTNSSFLHPNFIVLDLDVAYMPGTSKNNYIVIPDLSEVRTVKKLDIATIFFKQKPINISFFGNFNESYASRENLTDIKSINKHWGSSLVYSNKFLPFTLDFHNRKWYEEELQSNRRYTYNQLLFNASASKSFTKLDRNEIRYSHDDNVNINQYQYKVATITDNIDFLSRINLDADNKYTFITSVSNINQRGNIDLKRFQASEIFQGQLDQNFSVYGSYNLYNIRQVSSKLQQHNIDASLQHKLYKSLISRLNFEYNYINHTVYKELSTKPGVEFNYTKKIPKGQLAISYKYDRYHLDYSANSSTLNIISEQYTLSDDKIELLRLPDISLESVVVKDVTGTLIYINGIDYILLERGKYIEIRRIPGGLISNNGSVLVDYTATQPGSYKYDANTHLLNTSVNLFNNLISVYYRFGTQDYTNLVTTEFVTLNYFTQNLAGFRLDFDFIDAGVEYENYKSSILPYHMWRYFLNFQKNIGKKLMFTVNGNIQDYQMLDKPEPENQKYMDISGKMFYTVYKQSRLNFDIMYRKQTGRGIDLDLMSAKAEINSSINRLFFTLGVEVYRRNYVGETLNFKGTYFKLVRKF